MTDKVSLTIKIDPSLKETIKAVALENQLSLSEVVTLVKRALLQRSGDGKLMPLF
ncbi:hypothetical protein ACZ87_03195, partial [Candidatus Erwinia dacicola]